MDVTAIVKNGVIDTPLEILIVVLIAFLGIIVLFKFANVIESMPVSEPKKKAVKEVKKEIKKEVKKDINKETKREIVKDVNESVSQKDKTFALEERSYDANSVSSANNVNVQSLNSCEGYVYPYTVQTVPPNMYMGGGYVSGYDNYLHDRFVVSPTSIDYVDDKKISDDFLSEKELDEIHADDVINKKKSQKENLHDRINQMTSHNKETREKLLDEFEGLSREMKLLIIDNIINKM